MNDIKQVPNIDTYVSLGKPTTESRVVQILSGNTIKPDGINVQTKNPCTGDAVYEKSGEYYIFKGGDCLNNELLTAKGLSYKGVVLYCKGDKIVYLNGNFSSFPSKKYLDVCQYAITAISATTLSIKLRMSPDYSVDTTVAVELTSAEINATSASEISAAVAAKAETVGDTKAWWAYLADAQGNKVSANGTQIIIQCDSCVDYRFYNVSATGCTISHITWGDMPANSTYMKRNGRTTSSRGMMNIQAAATYWATNGRTPDSIIHVNGETGDTNPITKSAFQTSEYAAELRTKYQTYEDYIRGEFAIMYPNINYGAFKLPNGKDMTEMYGPMTAPTKDESTKAKFPALNWAYSLGGGNYLCGISEGTFLMMDDNLTIINATQAKAGKATISTATARWFAQRSGTYYAWYFGGTAKSLVSNNVDFTYQCLAVSLLKINK